MDSDIRAAVDRAVAAAKLPALDWMSRHRDSLERVAPAGQAELAMCAALIWLASQGLITFDGPEAFAAAVEGWQGLDQAGLDDEMSSALLRARGRQDQMDDMWGAAMRRGM